MATSIDAGLARLRAAADQGELERLCIRRDVDLVVLFGSATRQPATAADIDLAIRFEHGRTGDPAAVVTDLIHLTGSDAIDVMDLRRAGPVARFEALGRGVELLYEADPSIFAEAQMFAVRDYLDTKPLRRAQLELMGA
ncbi:nucleotidyltransferase domain-containing protein [Georgenia subflava]|uniref:Polymerase beta nucleotidyltransferase domain-containing protein n=1 Tax=Georgenia subflava TaxID=1622177 RepID=A0A6N7EQS3_9MICO|nr:nucleotidyltransferase domain-containing protein [Georgenia subflava]MPV38486.1 hypothetical protein [Georgenia subflava]